MSQEAKVGWYSKITGFSSSGSWLPLEVVEDFVDYGNMRYPDIHHYVILNNEKTKKLSQGDKK